MRLIERNSYPLREWHIEHMQKAIVKYVAGISNDASLHQRRLYKKYGGNLSNVNKSIDLDMKHGVTKQEVLAFFDIRNNKGIERLDGLDSYLGNSNNVTFLCWSSKVNTPVAYRLISFQKPCLTFKMFVDWFYVSKVLNQIFYTT